MISFVPSDLLQRLRSSDISYLCVIIQSGVPKAQYEQGFEYCASAGLASLLLVAGGLDSTLMCIHPKTKVHDAAHPHNTREG